MWAALMCLSKLEVKKVVVAIGLGIAWFCVYTVGLLYTWNSFSTPWYISLSAPAGLACFVVGGSYANKYIRISFKILIPMVLSGTGLVSLFAFGSWLWLNPAIESIIESLRIMMKVGFFSDAEELVGGIVENLEADCRFFHYLALSAPLLAYFYTIFFMFCELHNYNAFCTKKTDSEVVKFAIKANVHGRHLLLGCVVGSGLMVFLVDISLYRFLVSYAVIYNGSMVVDYTYTNLIGFLFCSFLLLVISPLEKKVKGFALGVLRLNFPTEFIGRSDISILPIFSSSKADSPHRPMLFSDLTLASCLCPCIFESKNKLPEDETKPEDKKTDEKKSAEPTAAAGTGVRPKNDSRMRIDGQQLKEAIQSMRSNVSRTNANSGSQILRSDVVDFDESSATERESELGATEHLYSNPGEVLESQTPTSNVTQPDPGQFRIE